MSGARRRLRPFLVPHWPALAGAAASTVVLTIAELAGPWPLKLVIDRVARHDGSFELRGGDLWFLALVSSLALAIALAQALTSYASDMWLNRAGERIVHDLRVAVYAHLQRLSLAFHHRRPTGDLVTRVTGDVAAVRVLFTDSLGELVGAVLLLLGMATITIVLDPLLAVGTFAVSPLLAYVTFRYTRRVKTLARTQRAQEGEIASLATEALSAMQVVKVFGSEAYEHERIEERSESRRRVGVETARVEARFAGLIDVIGAAAATIAIVLGVVRVAAGALSPGDLVVFVSYASKTYRPLRTIARQTTKAQRALARADRIAEVLADDAVLQERSGAFAGGRASGTIDLERVSFAYEADRPALERVDLHIPAGQRVALVGRSGAGKSTLGALVARLYDPDSGRVAIDGRDARDCALGWLRDQVGVLLQDTVLFSGSVADNIAYATDASDEEIEAAARAAGAHEFVSRLPDGYETRLGPRGIGLSGGQRQRIGIARVLLRDPPILVLDEPTTGLDATTEAQVMDALERLMHGRTTILITHADALARRAERVVVVEDGRVAADGPPAVVLGRPAGARPRPAAHAGLPSLPALLDADRMAGVLQRSLGGDRPVADVRITDVRLKPHRELIVRYDVTAGERTFVAVAKIRERGKLAKQVVELDETAAALAPARSPLDHDDELGALIMWLPVDVELPALATAPSALVRRLRAEGIHLAGADLEPELVSYKPLGRAVLRLDGHVLKLYSGARRCASAAAALAAVSKTDVRTPRLEAVLPDLHATVQSSLEGRVPHDAEAIAGDVGELLRALHALPAHGVPRVTNAARLVHVAKHAEVVSAILPQLEQRLRALLRRLEARTPDGRDAVLSHGDFEAGQLLVQPDGLAVLDLDDLCVAAPALDHATYAAHLVDGNGPGLDAARAALASLATGYGRTPGDLDWHLAAALVCRAPAPFRRFRPDWPERVEGHVAAAEEALAS
jgi:ABC-type multidrug transport system fused ATPase/permease subunit